MTRVVDTSVVLAWYVEEDGSAAALPLLGTELIAPNLLMTELANALWKKWRRSEIRTCRRSRSWRRQKPSFRFLRMNTISNARLDWQ